MSRWVAARSMIFGMFHLLLVGINWRFGGNLAWIGIAINAAAAAGHGVCLLVDYRRRRDTDKAARHFWWQEPRQ